MVTTPAFNPTDPARARSRAGAAAFTLVEVLVSMAILLMMLLIMTQVISTTQKTWHAASARLTQFREARIAFDTITRGLSQATLNPYRDFNYGSGTPGLPPGTSPLLPPIGFMRWADLGIHMDIASNVFTNFGSSNMPGHAVIFQAPLGYTAIDSYHALNSLLCVSGYFVLFGSDVDYLPTGLISRLEPRSRYRLYQYQPTTESNPVFYNKINTPATPGAWATIDKSKMIDNLGAPLYHPGAENILALVLAPSFNTGAPAGAVVALGAPTTAPSQYSFNSYTDTDPAKQFHLPTSVQVVMVAMDEESASRVALMYGTNAPSLFNATFTNPGNLDGDLRLARLSLEKLRVNYRIFSSTVFIPAAEK